MCVKTFVVNAELHEFLAKTLTFSFSDFLGFLNVFLKLYWNINMENVTELLVFLRKTHLGLVFKNGTAYNYNYITITILCFVHYYYYSRNTFSFDSFVAVVPNQ